MSDSDEFQPDNCSRCAQEQCKAYALGGGRCELEAGHVGKHSRAWADGGVFEWTSESQLKLADKHASRFD